jgi:hypothetical protein
MAAWREKVGYYYPSGLEKTLYKWDIYVPLVTKELIKKSKLHRSSYRKVSMDPLGTTGLEIRTALSR